MSDEKREESKPENELHEKLDKIAKHLDSLHKRMDAYEGERDKDRKEREDRARKDADEEKERKEREDRARKDAEEKENNSKAALKEEREENSLKENDSRRSRKDAEEESALNEARRDALSAGHKLEMRGDVEGYEEGGVFHPIRGTKGYKKKLAGDSARKDADEEKERKEREDRARKDAEEHEKERADAKARHDSQEAKIADLEAKLALVTKHIADVPSEDRAKLTAVWEQGERLAQMYGDSQGCSKWMPGESLADYTRRVYGKFKKHSAAWKDVDLSKITDSATLDIAIAQIYHDAEEVALHPKDVPAGVVLTRQTVDQAGRKITRFVGSDDGAVWRDFANPDKFAVIRQPKF